MSAPFLARPLDDARAVLRFVGSRARQRLGGAGASPRPAGDSEVEGSRLPSPVAPTVDYGVETLRRMATVDRYNDWIYRRIEPHLGQRILEVGCGLGNMTQYFLGRDQLVSIDVLPASVDQVHGLYAAQPGFQALHSDICDERLVEELKPHRFDTVVCLNVLEHILDDTLAIQHMARLLEPGGKLILFVPAGSYLYGELDIALAHHRRYDRRSVLAVIQSAGLVPEVVRYMNPAGIPGWFLASRVLKRHAPPRGLLHLFNFLTPLFMWADEKVEMPIGLSVLCIARRD
jgi:2-polyprenyl-3-methyl-5-hydroxy-6-metoxy-1,4-benzoquinol methylase